MKPRTTQIASLVAVLVAGLATAAPAATIGYWQLEDGAPPASAGAVNSQTNSGDLAGTAGGSMLPQYSAMGPGKYIHDGANGPLLNTNDASMRFFNVGGVNSNSGSMVSIQDAAGNNDLLEPTNGFTIEGFVKINSDVNFATLVGKPRTGTSNSTFVIDTNNNGTLRARIDSDNGGTGQFNQGITTGFSLNDDEWHHFALTYDATTRTASLFGDYNFLASTVLGNNGTIQFTNDTALLFGTQAGGRALDGWLDEIRYSSGVLTPDQFLVAQMPTPAALPAGLALMGLTLVRRKRA